MEQRSLDGLIGAMRTIVDGEVANSSQPNGGLSIGQERRFLEMLDQTDVTVFNRLETRDDDRDDAIGNESSFISDRTNVDSITELTNTSDSGQCLATAECSESSAEYCISRQTAVSLQVDVGCQTDVVETGNETAPLDSVSESVVASAPPPPPMAPSMPPHPPPPPGIAGTVPPPPPSMLFFNQRMRK